MNRLITDSMEIKAGYRAFNGYVFTQQDADNYNNGYYANEDERHRTFVTIISQKYPRKPRKILNDEDREAIMKKEKLYNYNGEQYTRKELNAVLTGKTLSIGPKGGITFDVITKTDTCFSVSEMDFWKSDLPIEMTLAEKDRFLQMKIKLLVEKLQFNKKVEYNRFCQEKERTPKDKFEFLLQFNSSRTLPNWSNLFNKQ